MAEPASIARTKATLAVDIAAVTNPRPGTFFDDPTYFDSLPHGAQLVICAIQDAGANPERPGYCNAAARLSLATFNRTKSRDVLETAIAFYAMAVKYVTADDPQRTSYTHSLARALQQKWEVFKDSADLDATIDWYRKTVEIADQSSPQLTAYICDVAVSLTWRLDLHTEQNINDFEEARASYEIVCTLSRGSRLHAMMLSNHGEFIRTTASLSVSRLESATDAINLQLQAIALLEKRENLPVPYGMIYCNAARSYQARFELTQEDEDLQSAVSFFMKALDYPSIQSSNYCVKGASEFAQLLQCRATDMTHLHTKRAYLGKAWDLLQKCIEYMPANYGAQGWILDRCHALCLAKFETDGDPKNLDDAVEFSKKATAFTEESGSWDYFRNLSYVLLVRHEQGMSKHLDEALSAIKIAINKVGQNSLHRGSCIWGLGKVLRKIYDGEREENVLRGAIQEFLAAENLMEHGDKTRALVRNDLGNAHCSMFQHTRLHGDIDAGVTWYKKAMEDIHQADPTAAHPDALMIYSSLGQALLHRYMYWDSVDDLDGSIKYVRKSLSGINENHPRFVFRAGNLSYALQLKFEMQKGTQDLLLEAQDLLKRALRDPTRLSAPSINILQTHLGNIYVRTGGLPNLELALEHYQLALKIENVEPSLLATAHVNIAATFKETATITANPEHYFAALTAYEHGGKMLPENDPMQWSIRLGTALILRRIYEGKMVSEYHKFGERALEEFRKLANEPTVETRHRIGACGAAASLLNDMLHEPSGARDFLIQGINLLPGAVLLHSKRWEQLRFIKQFHYLPGGAAATSLAAGDAATTAIQLLERGRGLIWDRLLNERTAVDDLREADESLYAQFQQLRGELFQRPSNAKKDMEPMMSLAVQDEIRIRRHQTAEQYTELVDTIRQREGFKDFLKLPSDPTDLQEFGLVGPIIFVNVSQYGSDALIITKNDVYSLNLPSFGTDALPNEGAMFLSASDRIETNYREAKDNYEKAMKWLWDVAAKPILDNIDFSQYEIKLGEKPRVFWVSAGWIGILPIHAAGDFSKPPTTDEPRSVHERVVSSYTPSLRALAFARNRSRVLKVQQISGNQTALLIAMPTTPSMEGQNLNVEPELESVTETLHGSFNLKTLRNACSNEVQPELETCCIAHFACHGVADMKDPSLSTIRLEDWAKKPLNVRMLLRIKPSQCRLAYLSACESSKNRDLPLCDEGIHVAGAFHMAGVPHTVSALWKVSDMVSAQVASPFYKNLKGDDGVVDFDRSAVALHSAIQLLRDSGVDAILWGAYIHSGA